MEFTFHRAGPQSLSSAPSSKSSSGTISPPTRALSNLQIESRMAKLRSETSAIAAKAPKNCALRLERTLTSLELIKIATETTKSRKSEPKPSIIDSKLSHSRSVALLSSVNQLLSDCKSDENRDWERKYRQKERDFGELTEEREKMETIRAQGKSGARGRPSLDTLSGTSEGGKISRWPTLTSLSSPQGQIPVKMGFPDGRLLGSMQKDLKMAEIRAETRETELLSLKLAYEETRNRLDRLELIITGQNEEKQEKTEEIEEENRPKQMDLAYFQRFYRLKRGNEDGKVQKITKQYKNWMKSFETEVEQAGSRP